MRTDPTRTDHIRRIERRSYHRRRIRHLTAGLTAHGAVRRRPFVVLQKWEYVADAKAKNLAKYHRRTQRRAALGLNSRGRPYKTRVLERAWQRMKLEMEAA